ncbi:helix-turn-helix domain-containing protein [Acinetobacter indicus]|uniref:helix-turn-helix domain-containing protein n=1 Tax=Acinetobacter indicus TaxID=756892 RepID=UPI001E4956BA|nr:helix-turn-helix domain-containing protein [Acinetobacter indicus]
MLTGIQLRAYPTQHQKLILSQWMGCARFVWNAKCDEDKYFRGFARKFATFDHYYETQDQKNTLTLNQMRLVHGLQTALVQYKRTQPLIGTTHSKKSIKGLCGRPKRKKRRQIKVRFI